uniref:Uncharacterized protein n=1 Tax=Cacopsylla melanoneura TaxID=428564 RepID=A0A8D9BSQ2_9HEMI
MKLLVLGSLIQQIIIIVSKTILNLKDCLCLSFRATCLILLSSSSSFMSMAKGFYYFLLLSTVCDSRDTFRLPLPPFSSLFNLISTLSHTQVLLLHKICYNYLATLLQAPYLS